MPVLPSTDENAVPLDSAYRHDAVMSAKTATTRTAQNARRIALGDVTARSNVPSVAVAGSHNVKNRTGLYSQPLKTRDEPDVDPVQEPTVQAHSDYNHEAANNSDPVDAADEGDASSVLSDREPLLLTTSDESQHAIQLAHQQLHSDVPDPLDEDTYDLVMVVEYTPEIFRYLHELEKKWQPHPRYMLFQPELKWSYRSTLIDWIVQVHARFQLLPETLYLTVNIIDRFLSRKTVTLNRFQLVGAAALFLAAKFEEINCPTIKEILYMLDNSYTKDELLKAERYMINALEFELGWPGPMSFLRRVSKADDYEYDIRTLAKYLLETTIMDSRLVSAQPSWLAAGAYYLSRVILGFNDWTQHHIFYSNYTAEQLFPLATVVLENCRHATQRHQAIFEKYSERRHRRSSQVVARWIAMAEQRVT
ncbi:LAME_0B06722g1_1 [Lachancea meyersii CBS 8951]|uniref:LAME_0B06722g1_1 n=1 Tax=Lachancea meyersii CBS 8951 TaxID=1266667 RepID=A0A1G4IWX9_9SACH|nr:LAME_0B06722g1_1 [Lachancea meyersii CBS 8951]